MSTLNPGTIYVVKEEDTAIPQGTRVEFIEGPEGDMFTDGNTLEYYVSEEVSRSPDQTPLELSRDMSIARSYALSGIEPPHKETK